ncbi:hypothetical protein QQZ08_000514 [Neonectria magnoliae]|uniref:trans-L-3-hydroxyproline dehydratase n=1 Tax=Neonectria magnoliae TaxID=2732573 RepID=A0ABR1IIT6_9HYPO
MDLIVDIYKQYRWPELKDRLSVVVSLACPSAVSCHIDLEELGFPADTFSAVINFQGLGFATKQLKAALNNSVYVKSLLRTPNDNDNLVFGVMVQDKETGSSAEGTDGAETGFYLFGDQHLDRSPTGSVVAARNTIKYFKGELGTGRSWTYHSVLTKKHGKAHGFVGKTMRQVDVPCRDGSTMTGVEVQVSGHAYYTGTSTCIVERGDRTGKDGFLLGL